MTGKIGNAQTIKRSGKKWRPRYHFTAPKGWMNDPNGLIYYHGWYHLFYQYNPKECEWGSMHWGHAVSEDMMHWKDLPIALLPDQSYDNHAEGGCFSGSAVQKDELLYLFYSAAVKERGKTRQTQCMAFSEDGIHFKKYKDNPIISHPPEGASDDFRDPKVFSVGNVWYMVIGGSIGGAENKGDGRIFLYKSLDLYDWHYEGTILESGGRLGTMFECPDMFELDGKWIVTCSPMNHPDCNKALYCIGTMDFEHCRYRIEKIGNLDYGFDYYAPQSFLDRNGNRVQIAWQNGWMWMPWCEGFGPTSVENWRGSLSIPRRVNFNEKKELCLYPIAEMGQLVAENKTYQNLSIGENIYYLLPAHPKTMSIKILINIHKIFSKFIEIGVLGREDQVTVISVDLVGKVVTLDKRNADSYGGGKINCSISLEEDSMELLILVDYSSIELYIDHGRYCITTNVYPEVNQTECWIRTPYKEAVIDRIELGSGLDIWKEK